MFDSYLPFQILSRKEESDSSFHVSTTYYKVKPANGPYIIEAEEYIKNTFVLKFYPAEFKNHPSKYQLITGSKAIWKVMGTCLKIFESFYKDNPNASFGFIATPSLINGSWEVKENNQRFRIYKQTMQNYFGGSAFTHYVDTVNSSYLMANNHNDLFVYVKEMQEKFSEMYPDMLNLQFTEL